jgi:hypothetical protein
MTSSQRTFWGIAAFVPLAIILLVTFACLPVPVGEPEKSKVDPALTGMYKAKTDSPDDTQVAVLRPWDDKTYLVTYLQNRKNNGKVEQQITLFKGWLTTIAEKTFMTLQPMNEPRADAPQKPEWVVLRFDQSPTGLDVRMVNADSEFLKGLTTREEFEAAIKAHVSDVALYGDPMEFKKLGKEDQALIDDLQTKLNLKAP